MAVLVNDSTGSKANIGQYHVDYTTQSSQQMSGDIGAAFQQVTGAAPAATNASTTAATTTAAPAPVTDAQQQTPQQTQETQAQAPAETPTE